MSEWQPGDVVSAFIGSRQSREIAVYCGDEKYPWRLLTSTFGNGGFDQIGAFNVTEVHRLTVIDPEDLDAVADLWKRFSMGVLHDQDGITAMQAALREFANPTPPIEEPSSLYAVVEDRGGDQWCHIGERVWRSLTATGQFMVEKHWHDAGTPLAGNVVRVLSEGVTDV